MDDGHAVPDVLVPLVAVSVVAVALLIRYLIRARRGRESLRAFEERWSARSHFVTDCQVWRLGQRARGACALTDEILVYRTHDGQQDIEVPLAVVREGGVRERSSGRKMLALQVAGQPVFLEVAPALLDHLVAALRSRP